jgi:hypothetical protein
MDQPRFSSPPPDPEAGMGDGLDVELMRVTEMFGETITRKFDKPLVTPNKDGHLAALDGRSAADPHSHGPSRASAGLAGLEVDSVAPRLLATTRA